MSGTVMGLQGEEGMREAPGVTARGQAHLVSRLCLPDHDLEVRMEQFPARVLHPRRKAEGAPVRQRPHRGHLQRFPERSASPYGRRLF